MDKKLGANIIVGIFVTLGLVLFVLLIFNMGGGQGVFSSQYLLHGRFGHVKGLHYGSEITLNGLRVGTVKNISIDLDSKELIVELVINTKFQNRIRTSSVAKVVTQGMLGDKYIDISLGNLEDPILKHNETISTSEEKDIFSKGGGLIDELSKKLDKRGEIDTLLNNLSRASGDLASITSEAKRGKGLEKLNRTMAHMESILKKIDDGEGTLGALVNDPTLYEDAKSIMGGAKRSSVLQYFVNQFKDSGEAEKQKKKKE